MASAVEFHLPCDSCSSSDAMTRYDDGSTYCFSCKKRSSGSSPVPKSDTPKFTRLSIEEVRLLAPRGYKDRLLTKVVAEFYGVRASFDQDGEIDTYYYPYDKDTAFKVRTLPKKFAWLGKSTSLFGQDRFPGGGKRVIVVEGEVDALSVAQASYEKYHKWYPVVALSSAVMTKSLIDARAWLRSFNEVILFLDSDQAGQDATREAAKIIGYDKVKIAKPPHDCKDANDVLLKHGASEVLKAVFDAVSYVPAAIINKEQIWESILYYDSLPAIPYPPCLDGVNEKLKGHRGGEIALFVSGTGSGKSTMIREDILHLLKTTDSKIGIVSLEEAPHETAIKLAGMEIHKNPNHVEVSKEELKEGFDAVFNTDRLVVLNHQGSINDGSILDHLEYMCLIGCKYIFVDHITILVSEGVDNLQGNEAQDKMMNNLLRLVKKYPEMWLGLVSHLRKAQGGKPFEQGNMPSIDDIRGSGSLKQVSFDIIAFARDMTAEKDIDRNHIKISVLKARTTGLTGPVKGAQYDNLTGRLTAAGQEEFTSI